MSQQETFGKKITFSGEKALKELRTACKYITEFKTTRKGDVIYLHVPTREKLSGYLENEKLRIDIATEEKRIAFKINVKKPITRDDATFVGFFANALGHLVEPTDKDEAVDLEWGELWFRLKRLDVAIVDDALSIIIRPNWNMKPYLCRGKIKTGGLRISFEPYFRDMKFTIKGKLTAKKIRKIREVIRAFEMI
ncbi:MAG: hypothetical protein JHC26_11770 [Thermofilum sp.]|jgi:hypothetical protein|uniref:hypothetical protein n=1 Tax=Thermofilum sp. TaxID=1961369 RepID=UPI00258A6BEE|nr:hypothetical protein [Thermofilum sp.]MCI4409761.1 hypothetical protein [Thermofilum sp.]